jgi:hypothetical protein
VLETLPVRPSLSGKTRVTRKQSHVFSEFETNFKKNFTTSFFFVTLALTTLHSEIWVLPNVRRQQHDNPRARRLTRYSNDRHGKTSTSPCTPWHNEESRPERCVASFGPRYVLVNFFFTNIYLYSYLRVYDDATNNDRKDLGRKVSHDMSFRPRYVSLFVIFCFTNVYL